MSVTNSIIAPLPCAMEVDAAKVAFESFGEVFRVKRLEKFKNFVQVSFYDVRAAESAVKAFSEAGCIPGPQVGERTVKMAGDDQLSTKDFRNISEVLKSKDGSFYLEFYDIRDAMRYRTPQESAMELSGPQRPPGLSFEATGWQLVIRHLPAKLLTKVMMDAVFQQAGFEFLDFVVEGDKVLAHFDDQMNAQKCAAHFSGCQWDKSGTSVSVDLIPPKTAGCKGLSAEAPAFQPVPRLTAEAPAFVPSWLPKAVDTPQTRAPKLAFGSDTSTECGDSEDERGSPGKALRGLQGTRTRSGSAS